jgi:hypothetical protein
VQKLIQLARDNGGEDNISVAVIKFGSDMTATAPVPVTLRPKRRAPVVPIVGVLAAVLLLAAAVITYRLGLLPIVQPALVTPATAWTPAAPVAPTYTPAFREPTHAASPAPAAAGAGTATPTAPQGAIGAEVTSTLAPTSSRVRPSPTMQPSAVIKPTNTRLSQPLRQPPILKNPNGSTEPGPQVTFAWEDPLSLQPNEGYAVLVWREGEQAGRSGLDLPTIHDACRARLSDTSLRVNDISKVLPASGVYNWRVVVVDMLRSDGKHLCTVISDEPTPFRFTYSADIGGGEQKPPEVKPPD